MIWGIILLVAFVSFFYINYEVRKNEKFLESIEDGFVFYEKIRFYKGYIVCVQKKNILTELQLLRRIVSTINKKNQCIVINLNESRSLDLKLIKKLNVHNVPSVFKITSQDEHKEIFNYQSLYTNGGMDNRQVIRSIEKLIE